MSEGQKVAVEDVDFAPGRYDIRLYDMALDVSRG
jgi:hypothetical protein